MSSLHKHLDVNILPEDYSGKKPKLTYSSTDWYPVIQDLQNYIAGKSRFPCTIFRSRKMYSYIFTISYVFRLEFIRIETLTERGHTHTENGSLDYSVSARGSRPVHLRSNSMDLRDQNNIYNTYVIFRYDSNFIHGSIHSSIGFLL